MAISGKVGAVFVQTEDAPILFEDESTAADAEYKKYTITDTALRYWDKTALIVVKVDDEVVSQGFEVQYLGGIIIFDTPLTADEIVTVSGKYIKVEQHGGFFSWSADLEADMGDVTTYESGGWKENLPTIKGFSASAESYWGDSEFFSRLGKEVIIALYIDTTVSKTRYEGYGVISSDSVETAVDDIINESIEIQGTGKLYYTEG